MDPSITEQLVRAHVFIRGQVQGVDIRGHTKRRAQALRLTGWVRDLLDGSVEAVFEGREEAVKQAINWCYRGTPSAKIEDVEINFERPTGDFNRFLITW